MMSLTFGLFTQVSGSGPLGPLVKKIIQECSLGDYPPKLLKPFRSVEQDGPQG